MTTPPTVAPATARAAVFSPPRLRRTALRRPRLNRRLDDALEGTFTVVSGPAGYGKSTLAADWPEQLELPHTWLSLDRSHRDPRVLLRDLAGAVRAEFPHAMRKFARRLETARGETDARLLVREFSSAVEADVEGLFVFVIDDVHALAGSPAIDALDALVHHPPPNVRLVLLTRAWDVLPELARLVATGAAVALLEADLAFDDAEAARLLRRSRLRDRDTIRALTRRADGWPAALALLAEHHKTAPAGDPDATGAFVLSDFLDREVLARLTPAQLAMLEICAVLELFEADVLHELDGSRRGAATLRKLELHTQLIVRADDATTYRIHGLLAEHLVARLTRDAPNRLRALRGAARAAYERRGNFRRAVAIALDVCDWAEAARLLARLRDELFSGGEWPTLASWLGRLPDPVLQSNPDLALAKARVAIKLGDARSGLLQLERIPSAGLSVDQQAQRLMHMSVSLRQLGHTQSAVDACEQALSIGPLSARVIADLQYEAGVALGIAGHSSASHERLQAALHTFESLGDSRGIGEATAALGLVYRDLARTSEALMSFRRAASTASILGDKELEARAIVCAGDVQREIGALSVARSTLELALAHSRKHSIDRVARYAMTNLAELELDLGNLQRCDQLLSCAGTMASEFTDHLMHAHYLYLLTMLRLEQGRVEEADAACSAARATIADAGQTVVICRFEAALGAVRIAQHRESEALELLDAALRTGRSIRAAREEARVQLRRASALLRLGRADACENALAEVRAIVDKTGRETFLWADARLAADAVSFGASRGLGDLFLRLGERKPAAETASTDKDRRPAFTANGLGPLQVLRTINGQEIQWRSDRSKEMLFFLLHHDRPARKEQIGVAIWPDIEPERLNSAFHSTLYRLRGAIGTELVTHGPRGYALLDSSAFAYDVNDFRALIRRARSSTSNAVARRRLLNEAAGLYGGPFADGLDSEWAHDVRADLSRQYLAVMAELGRLALARGDVAEAVDIAARIRLESADDPEAIRLEADVFRAQGDHAAPLGVAGRRGEGRM